MNSGQKSFFTRFGFITLFSLLALTFIISSRMSCHKDTINASNDPSTKAITFDVQQETILKNQLLANALTPQGEASPALLELLEKTIPANAFKRFKGKNTIALRQIVELTNESQPIGWRRLGQIRWETQQFYNNQRDELLPLFKNLGLTNEVLPSHNQYEHALIKACTVQIFRKRLAFLKRLYEQGVRFESLTFLTGKRQLYALETKEALMGKNQTILPVRANWKPNRPLPTQEFDMLKWVYEQSDLSIMLKNVPVNYVIGKPLSTENSCRPQSKSVCTWVESNPKPGPCLLILDQPYIIYEQQVFQTLMDSRFTVETAGPAADSDTTVEIYLDALAHALHSELKYREFILSNQN